MPNFLREHIARTVAAQRAHPQAAPAVGQIRALSAVNTINGQNSRPLGRNVGVLLGAHLGGKRWQGWLVTADTSYATDRDLLIEEDDGPSDPQAGMVMTRLALRVIIQGDEPIFAKLSPARLGAVIALAEAPAGGEPMPPDRDTSLPATWMPSMSASPARRWATPTTRATPTVLCTSNWLMKCPQRRRPSRRRPRKSPPVAASSVGCWAPTGHQPRSWRLWSHSLWFRACG